MESSTYQRYKVGIKIRQEDDSFVNKLNLKHNMYRRCESISPSRLQIIPTVIVGGTFHDVIYTRTDLSAFRGASELTLSIKFVWAVVSTDKASQ